MEFAAGFLVGFATATVMLHILVTSVSRHLTAKHNAELAESLAEAGRDRKEHQEREPNTQNVLPKVKVPRTQWDSWP